MSIWPNDDEPLSTGTGAGTYPAFVAGLYVPTVVDEEGVPIPASELGVAELDDDAAVMLPSDAEMGGYWRDDEYRVEVPARLVWNSNLPSDDFGEVRVEAPDVGWSKILDEPTGSVEFAFHTFFDVRTTNAPNLFRDTGLGIEVSFEDSPRLRTHAGDKMNATAPYATPNKSGLYWKRMVSIADEVYGRGVDAADKVTRVDLGQLRKRARFFAYAQVAHIDLLTEGDLLRDAAVEGIAAFEEPIEESTDLTEALDQEVYTTLTGPTVVYHHPSDGGG